MFCCVVSNSAFASIVKYKALLWQDNSPSKDLLMNYDDAFNYCDNLELSGYKEWKIPSISQLQSIIDLSTVNPSVVNIFDNVLPFKYWSSTPFSVNKEGMWVVNFVAGRTEYYRKRNNKFNVKCVHQD
jgi:hypothetical protein